MARARRPAIGITAIPRPVRTMYGEAPAQTCTDALVASVADAGGVPLVLPVVRAEDAPAHAAALDGLVLAGGQDVDAASFGAERHPRSTWLSPARDAYELALLRRALALRLPVLGVCRGLQLANVALGGDVIGHVDGHDAEARHADVRHEVTVEADSLLCAAVGRAGPLAVNTLHHQAIGRLAEGLRVTARSGEGWIEAAEGDAPPWLVGVQWHPELMRDAPGGQALFDALVAAARG